MTTTTDGPAVRTTARSALPLAVDLTGRLVVAVGGGPVTARRVRSFLAEGAVVRVVSPWVCEDLRDLVVEGRLAWTARDYEGPGDLDGSVARPHRDGRRPDRRARAGGLGGLPHVVRRRDRRGRHTGQRASLGPT